MRACYPLSAMVVNLPCLWGSVSQLPSSHLSIHRVPTKLVNGINVPWRKLLLATAPVYEWIITRHASLCLEAGEPADATTPVGSAGLLPAVFAATFGFPSRTLPIYRIAVNRQSPGPYFFFLQYCLYLLCCFMRPFPLLLLLTDG